MVLRPADRGVRFRRWTTVMLVVGVAGGHAAADPAGSPDPVRNILDFDAAGDGQTLCTEAIQKAIDAAHEAGGGTVLVPAGIWRTGTLRLKSHVTLELANGATLLGSTDIDDYPRIRPAFRSYTDIYVYQSLIYAEDARHVAITGDGTIDGQGKTFPFDHPTRKYGERPYLIRMISCENVRIDGITLRNSPMWVQHYLACDHVNIHGVTVDSVVNHNNDGINIDCCRYVRISDCSIRSGDDAIVLKSTADRVCENVTVSNCVLNTRCNGLKLGTESNGGFRNIVLSGCAMYDIGLAGIALEMVDGGVLERVIVSDITIDNAGGAIFLRLGNRARPFKEDMDKPGMGTFRNVTIDNVIATGIGKTGSSITGLPGHPVRDVTLSNIRITYAGGGTREDAQREVPENAENYPEHQMFGVLPAYGFYCRHVDGLTLRDVDVRWEQDDHRPALVCDDVQNLRVTGLEGQAVRDANIPFVALNDVSHAMFRGCRTPPGAGPFVRLAGTTDHISVMNCDLSAGGPPHVIGPGVSRTAIFQSGNRNPVLEQD